MTSQAPLTSSRLKLILQRNITAQELELEDISYTVLNHEGFLDEKFGFLPEDFVTNDHEIRKDKDGAKRNGEEGADVLEPIEAVWMKANPSKTPLDYFEMLFSSTFYEFLVRATNLYAKRPNYEGSNIKDKLKDWKDTNEDEMKIFLGLLFLMGIIKVPKITDYWRNHYLFNLSFPKFMSQDRFLLILRCLYFNCSGKSSDALYEIRPLINYFNDTMSALYNTSGEILECEKERYGVNFYIMVSLKGLVHKLDVHEIPKEKMQQDSQNLASSCWYKKLGIHIIHIMLNNAFLLYVKYSEAKTDLYDYQLDVVEYLLPKPQEASSNDDFDIHLPDVLAKADNGKTLRKRCKYCMETANIRTDSIYGCSKCPGFPGFCLVPCFRLHHAYL